ncbi:hypothetical protein WA158_004247 [Blastocystis sp. Blastoise]
MMIEGDNLNLECLPSWISTYMSSLNLLSLSSFIFYFILLSLPLSILSSLLYIYLHSSILMTHSIQIQSITYSLYIGGVKTYNTNNRGNRGFTYVSYLNTSVTRSKHNLHPLTVFLVEAIQGTILYTKTNDSTHLSIIPNDLSVPLVSIKSPISFLSFFSLTTKIIAGIMSRIIKEYFEYKITSPAVIQGNPWADGEVIGCACGKGDNKGSSMLDCDRCHRLFHCVCVGLDPSLYTYSSIQDTTWYCEDCKITLQMENQRVEWNQSDNQQGDIPPSHDQKQLLLNDNTLEAQFNQFSCILKLCCEQNQDLKISLGKMVTYVAGTGLSRALEIEDKQEQGIQLYYCFLLLLVVVTPSSPSSLLPSLPLLHSYLTNDIDVSPAEQENIRDVLLDIIQKLVKEEWSSPLWPLICSSLYSIIGTCPQIKLIDKTISTLVTIISTLNLSPKPLWALLQAYIQPLYIPKGTKITAIVLNSQFTTKQSYSLSIPPPTISPANLYPAIYSLLLPYLSSLTSPPLYLATLKAITAGITRYYIKGSGIVTCLRGPSLSGFKGSGYFMRSLLVKSCWCLKLCFFFKGYCTGESLDKDANLLKNKSK